jgi:hypothetical protein
LLYRFAVLDYGEMEGDIFGWEFEGRCRTGADPHIQKLTRT